MLSPRVSKLTLPACSGTEYVILANVTEITKFIDSTCGVAAPPLPDPCAGSAFSSPSIVSSSELDFLPETNLKKSLRLDFLQVAYNLTIVLHINNNTITFTPFTSQQS